MMGFIYIADILSALYTLHTVAHTHTCNTMSGSLIVTHLAFFTEFPTMLTTSPFKTFWGRGWGEGYW